MSGGIFGDLWRSFSGADAKDAAGQARNDVANSTNSAVGAYKQYGDQAKQNLQPYIAGGQQDYSIYRNALANGTKDTFDKQYLDPNGPMQQALRQQFKFTKQGSNATGNFSGDDMSRSGVGAQALTKTLYNNYMPAQQAWLSNQKGLVDLGYDASRQAGNYDMQTGAGIGGAYNNQTQGLLAADKMKMDASNVLGNNMIGLAGTVVSAAGPGGMSRWGNNLGTAAYNGYNAGNAYANGYGNSWQPMTQKSYP